MSLCNNVNIDPILLVKYDVLQKGLNIKEFYGMFSFRDVTYLTLLVYFRGLPFSTYAPRGGGVKPHIHFHCVFHAKRGRGGRESM